MKQKIIHRQSTVNNTIPIKQRYPYTKKLLMKLVLGLVVLSFIIGWPQFAFAYTRCGFKMPVMAQPGSTFAGGSGTPYYYQPEDGSMYSPGITKYYYCTTQDAAADNVEPGPLSNASHQRDIERNKNGEQ